MKKIFLPFLSVMFLGFLSCKTLRVHRILPRKNIQTVRGVLTLHPLSTDLETNNGKFHFFLDGKNKILFMTSDSTVYSRFSTFLPDVVIPGRSIILEGTVINPFTIFTKEQFDELSSKWERLGISLNSYKIARIFNYGLKTPSSIPVEKKLNNVQWVPPPKQQINISKDNY